MLTKNSVYCIISSPIPISTYTFKVMAENLSIFLRSGYLGELQPPVEAILSQLQVVHVPRMSTKILFLNIFQTFLPHFLLHRKTAYFDLILKLSFCFYVTVLAASSYIIIFLGDHKFSVCYPSNTFHLAFEANL